MDYFPTYRDWMFYTVEGSSQLRSNGAMYSSAIYFNFHTRCYTLHGIYRRAAEIEKIFIFSASGGGLRT